MQATLRNLKLESLQRGQYQPREKIQEENLEELAASIRSQGLIEPLVVREIAKERYEIIAGERRWHAARMADLKEVPCLIGNYSDQQACALTLIENIQRQDLNPLEEANGYRRLMDEFAFLQEDIALMVGKSRSHIANLLRLLNLDESIKEGLREGIFSAGHARVLVGLPPREQLLFFHQAIEAEWSVRQLEQAVKMHKQESKSVPAYQKDRDVERLERMLSEQLGTPVDISHELQKGGWLKLKFFDNETLAGLLERLGLRYD